MPWHQLPTPKEAERAFVALTIDIFPTQCGVGAAGGEQMKVAVAVTVRGRKHTFALHKRNYTLVPNWPGQKRQLFLEPSAKEDTEHPSPELYIKSENTATNGKSWPSNMVTFPCKDIPCDIKQWKPQP